jgi:hypothetical protein
MNSLSKPTGLVDGGNNLSKAVVWRDRRWSTR